MLGGTTGEGASLNKIQLLKAVRLPGKVQHSDRMRDVANW